jgi:hypothetical protein
VFAGVLLYSLAPDTWFSRIGGTVQQPRNAS